jgi:hypothetical protein
MRDQTKGTTCSGAVSYKRERERERALACAGTEY